jgi:hypothetical protein
MRVHLNNSKLIAGTARVVRSDGSTTQELRRASVWRYAPGVGAGPSGWRRFPLVAEPGGPGELLEEFDTVVGTLNDVGVVGGGQSWHPTEPQLVTPAVWTVDPATGAVLSSARLGTTAQQEQLANLDAPGLVTALGQGLTPLAGGWIGTRCSSSAPGPVLASLAGPTLGLTELGPIDAGFGFPQRWDPRSGG